MDKFSYADVDTEKLFVWLINGSVQTDFKQKDICNFVSNMNIDIQHLITSVPIITTENRVFNFAQIKHSISFLLECIKKLTGYSKIVLIHKLMLVLAHNIVNINWKYRNFIKNELTMLKSDTFTDSMKTFMNKHYSTTETGSSTAEDATILEKCNYSRILSWLNNDSIGVFKVDEICDTLSKTSFDNKISLTSTPIVIGNSSLFSKSDTVSCIHLLLDCISKVIGKLDKTVIMYKVMRVISSNIKFVTDHPKFQKVFIAKLDELAEELLENGSLGHELSKFRESILKYYNDLETNDPISNTKLLLNGQDRFSLRKAKYSNNIYPEDIHYV